MQPHSIIRDENCVWPRNLTHLMPRTSERALFGLDYRTYFTCTITAMHEQWRHLYSCILSVATVVSSPKMSPTVTVGLSAIFSKLSGFQFLITTEPYRSEHRSMLYTLRSTGCSKNKLWITTEPYRSTGCSKNKLWITTEPCRSQHRSVL